MHKRGAESAVRHSSDGLVTRRRRWRAHGRAARDRDRKVGFDFVRSLVGGSSRLASSEVLPDEKGTTCAGFLARAAVYFAAHGITRVDRVMTDNAWAYRWSLREVIAELGARQVFIKPHCPWQNGKASNASTAPCKPSGPTGRCSPATPNGPPRLPYRP